MVNELRELLHENTAYAPNEHDDLAAVLRGGRRRVRRRRLAAVGGTALAAAAVVGLTSIVWPGAPDLDAAGVPAPDAPTLHLSDATPAVRGDDYRVLASHTNENLNRDNGQYLDGMTDDELILFRDGPRMDQERPRYALMDPATGEKEWLPDVPGSEVDQPAQPVHLGTDRLILTGSGFMGADASTGLPRERLFALVYDRSTRAWQRLDWPALPAIDGALPSGYGPDGRLYVRVAATKGAPPPGGWPMGPDGEADDADAAGDTYRLWSVSLSDTSDVRDEEVTLGALAFTDSSMVWTDSTNGDSGLVHVRALDTGEEHSFDPRAGDKCNLLSFGATGQRIVMSQYCGTYDGGVRDDRVQVLSTEGDQVVTIQDSSIDGSLADGSDVATVMSTQRGRLGTYVYDLESDRFLRVSEDVASWSTGGPLAPGHFAWSTPVNRRNGATFWIGELGD